MKNSIILIFLILFGSVQASTCSDRGKLTQEEYNETSLIFSGIVEKVDYDSTVYKRYFSMRVVNIFKGAIDTGIIIIETHGRLAASYIQKGDKLLLFLNYLNAKPFVSECSRQYYLDYFSATPPMKELQDILDRKDGYMEEYYVTDTLRSRGEIKNHLPIGKWEYFDYEGKLNEEGEYIDGMKSGLWKEYYNGAWHHQNYINGLKNGIHIEFFDNGKIKETGIYINDVKTGVWTSFYSNGTPKEQNDRTEKMYFLHSWDPFGNFMIKSGNGINKHYDNDGNPEKYSDSIIENGKWK